MHTVDASSDQSVGLADLSAPSLHVRRDAVSEASAEASFPKTATGTETDTAPTDIPRWKRVLDVTCIVLSAPLWLPISLLIMLWIKIASPGPVFFRQERIGFRGARFMVLKFRTMKVNADTRSHERHLEQLISADIPMTKLDSAGDPRIIAGGRILRATGLDELPQLFNVFRGEMSLVGPRPCTPHEFKSFLPWQQARVNALPGLTGYWQVNGKNRTTFTQMIEMDIFYTKNLSFWLDLTIILRTLPAIMAQVLETRIRNCLRAGTAPERGSSVSVAEKCS